MPRKLSVLLHLSLVARPEFQVIHHVLTNDLNPNILAEIRVANSDVQDVLQKAHHTLGGNALDSAITSLLRKHPEDVSPNEKHALTEIRTVMRHLKDADRSVSLAQNSINKITDDDRLLRALWE